jgi:hypothetical protein
VLLENSADIPATTHIGSLHDSNVTLLWDLYGLKISQTVLHRYLMEQRNWIEGDANFRTDPLVRFEVQSLPVSHQHKSAQQR